MKRCARFFGILPFIVSLLLPQVQAQTQWDLSMPWGPTEFHVLNAQKFADAVKVATGGEVQITIHPGASLGIKGPESLAAVADGLVPMAEMAGFQQVGNEPILGLESLPYLVDDYDQLALLYDTIRPAVETAFERNNQKVLYIVPWPSQNFFTKKELNTLDDLTGVKIRTYDKNSSELMERLGMTPVQIPSPDVVPALASGKLDAVMTSTTTAAAQKYWEFLQFVYPTNHLWASNMLTVNLDAWNGISPEHQQAIEQLAREMEP
jgi:TRAP-type C4-dicarboxylate transport system substrate-binding protein